MIKNKRVAVHDGRGDFKLLKISHPHIIDTSLHWCERRGDMYSQAGNMLFRRRGLKAVMDLLQLPFRTHTSIHSCEEDARAALQLVKW